MDARFAAQQRGGDRCRYELASHLAGRRGARYTFLTYTHGKAVLPPQCEIVTTDITPQRHPQSEFFEQISLPLIGRRLRADIYHGTFNVVPLLPAARRTVLTVHDMAVFAFPNGYGKRFAAYMRLLIRIGIRRADRIIAVSDATRDEILRYAPLDGNKIVTVLNGVGREFLEAAAKPTPGVDAVLNRLAVPRPYILFVGNLEPKKNLPRLIAAFGRMRSTSHLPHHLVIVGKPLAKGPGSGVDDDVSPANVHFTGFVEDADLPLLYRGADLVAYPSLYEGFGMPVLEGMAAGVPVLTSSVSSLPQVAGGSALLVDPFDVEAMAQGLHEALTNHGWRTFAVDSGRARASELTWEANTRATESVYLDLWSQREESRI